MKTLRISYHQKTNWTKMIAIIESVIFLGLGLFFLLFTQMVSSSMGLSFNMRNGLVDYKAIYGGLHLGLGVFMFINLLRRHYMTIILVVFTAISGMALVRAISMITDHAPTHTMFILLGIEIAGILINGWLLLWQD